MNRPDAYRQRDPLALHGLIPQEEIPQSSIQKVIAFRESIAVPARDFDEIDEAAADPIHDHAPQLAPKHKVRSVLSILDQLDKENTNRRFND